MPQSSLNLKENLPSVEQYAFEPIKGYPMLHWKGKRPFTGTQYYPAQLKEVHGSETGGWLNKIFWGDNLQVMAHLLKEFRGQVDLVYIDPPFDSKADYKKRISLKGKSLTNDHNVFEEKQYSDIWANDDYLQFMYERLILCRELLSEDGNFVLHCDSKKGHYLRCVMDELFGSNFFRNEIIWHYEKWTSPSSNSYQKNHDNLLFYSKSDSSNFNVIREITDNLKEKYEKGYLFGGGGGSTGLVVYDPDNPRVKELIASGKYDVVYARMEGKPISDVWKIPFINPVAKERMDYPTQKPEKLIDRIINTLSKPGDLVFDCFMGSGTTQAVAMKLGRRFIGADINLGAIQTTTKRLIGVAKEIQAKQKEKAGQLDLKAPSASAEASAGEEQIDTYYAGFEVYNVNHYDVFRNPVEAKDILMKALEIEPLPGGSIYDGEKDGRMVKIMPINRIATRADLNPLITGFDYKALEKLHQQAPGKAVEHLLLVCMGHEPDLAAALQKEVPYKLDIEVVDILRDQSRLEFKRDSEAEVAVEDGELVIRQFYPMNLLQKLSLLKENVDDWRELTESVMIDWNYDGAVFEPAVVDVPEKEELVAGRYKVPEGAGTIRVKITDVLSESLEIVARSS